MQNFVRAASQPTIIPLLETKNSSNHEQNPERSQSIEPKPANTPLACLNITLNNLLVRKKRSAYNLLFENTIQQTTLYKTKKFVSILQKYKMRQKSKCMMSLHFQKIKSGLKMKSSFLFANAIKRVQKRKKIDSLSEMKSLFLREIREKVNNLEGEHLKHQENMFSQLFIKEIKKLARFSPQTNFSVYIQAIEQSLQSLLGNELFHLQNQRRKKNQQGDSETVINLMNSSTLTLLTLNRNNKALTDEVKDLKVQKSRLADLEGVIEHIKKMDIQLSQKADTQLKKTIQSQLKTTEKKKKVHYLYDSRLNNLELLSKYVNSQKADPIKEVTNKLQILANSCDRVDEIKMLKDSLKAGGNPQQKNIETIASTLINLHHRQLNEVTEEQLNNYHQMMKETLNLGQTLQRMIKGKLFEKKKLGWTNLFKQKKQRGQEINILYDNIGKLFQIIEAKEKKVEQVNYILKVVGNLLSNQHKSSVEQQWVSIQRIHEDKKNIFTQINDHFDFLAFLQDQGRFFEYKEKIKQQQTTIKYQLEEIKKQQIKIKNQERLIFEQKDQLIVYEERIQRQESQKDEQQKKKEQKYTEELFIKEEAICMLKNELQKSNQNINSLSQAIQKLNKANEEKQKKVSTPKEEAIKTKQRLRTHERQVFQRKKQLNSKNKNVKTVSKGKNLQNGEKIINGKQSYNALKQQNKKLLDEINILKKSVQSQKKYSGRIEIENVMKLIYNILTFSSNLPNESSQAQQLWSCLHRIEKSYEWEEPIEGLTKTEEHVIQWISNYLLKSFKQKIKQKNSHLEQILHKVNQLQEDESKNSKKVYRLFERQNKLQHQQQSSTKRK